MRLYLASTSPARLTLLRSAGIEPVVLPSSVDEPAAVAEAERQHGPISPTGMVLLLARAKAEAVAAGTEGLDGLVLGGDSAFELDGSVYGKPHRPDIARERWLRQRGRTGLLHSGHWLIDARDGGTGEAVGEVATASVTFAQDIRDDEIDAYIATGEPLAVAGAFTIDSLGGPFIDRIEGDPSTVVGLSLPTLRRMLHRLGVTLPELWNRSASAG
ncbi:nucleoside triphosphate pyrophosphatase [Naasia sp. SYSU D00948]|uniref:Maf family protein n=1 Tax=Naasia sp. SYSU D00948 TaxID=2817379 RepID=UPI001B304DA9|nr:nucleoside triphosphate pyrophosphatase [Naasia sp. SYSU D00948]